MLVAQHHLLRRLPTTWTTMCLVFPGGGNVYTSVCVLLSVTDKTEIKQTVGTWQPFSSIPSDDTHQSFRGIRKWEYNVYVWAQSGLRCVTCVSASGSVWTFSPRRSHTLSVCLVSVLTHIAASPPLFVSICLFLSPCLVFLVKSPPLDQLWEIPKPLSATPVATHTDLQWHHSRSIMSASVCLDAPMPNFFWMHVVGPSAFKHHLQNFLQAHTATLRQALKTKR